MLPTITIFGRTLSSFVIMGLLGFFAAAIVSGLRAKRYNQPRTEPYFIGTFAGMGLLLGGSLLFGITNIPSMWYYRADFFVDIFGFMNRFFGGMIFYGGLFGAFAGICVHSKLMKLPLNTAMMLTIPVLPLAHAFMRIGCFLGGCCHGIEHPTMGIAFTIAVGAPNNIPLLPVQLYESGINLIIFAILWIYTKKDRNWVIVACLYGIMYSFIRFWLEFLRGDDIRGFVGVLSTSQFISIIVFVVCLFGIILKNIQKNA
jgi:phosphatidylglycerol:prolipoprotein diacylglycerol transferase